MKKEKNRVHPLMGILFILYLMLLFYLLFFSESYGRTMQEREYRYNLELFKEIKRFWNNRAALGWQNVMINLVGNVVAFAPFGFFMPLLTRVGKNVFGCVICSALFSASVELVQLVTKVGAFDVDDILLNAAGGLVGFFCYFLVWNPLTQRKKR